MRSPTRGRFPERKPRKDEIPDTYPTGRVCQTDGCGTVLSIYNGTSRCWLHGMWSELDMEGIAEAFAELDREQAERRQMSGTDRFALDLMEIA